MEHICESTGICKQYRFHRAVHEVLHDVSMTLDAGEVFGFIGPNGAGKTTLLRIMWGLAHPTKGKVTVLGTDLAAWHSRLPEGIGVLVEYPSFIPELTGRRNLELLASIRGVIVSRPLHQDNAIRPNLLKSLHATHEMHAEEHC